MRWFGRFLLWTAALAFPCYLLAPFYQRALLAGVLAVFQLAPRSDSGPSVDLAAANAIGIYAAMCLASTRAPWSRRLWVLMIGLPALAIVEWLTGVVALEAQVLEAARGEWSPRARRLLEAALDLPRWAIIPSLWLGLLGRWELPAWRSRSSAAHLPSAGERLGGPGQRRTG